MPKKNVVAIDYSGSTFRKENYWKKVKSLLEETNEIDTVYMFWDNRKNPEIAEKKWAIKITELLINKEGPGGATDPSTFIPVLYQALENNELPINLTLITDGQIAPSGDTDNKEEVIACIAECDKLLKEKKARFSEAKIYFVDTGGPIDKSVAAPFLRRADQYSICQNDKLIEKGSQLNLDRYRNEPERFLTDFQLILSQIANHVLGTDGKAIHTSLSELQKNLLDKLQKDNAEINKNSGLITQIMDELHKNDGDQAKTLVKKLFSKSEDTSFNKEKEIAVKFEQLFDACSKGYDFSFDKKESNRNQKASAVNPFSVDQFNQKDKDEQAPEKVCNFVCPITLDEDLALIPIKNYVQQGQEILRYQPIFLDISKEYQDYLISNPLALLSDTVLVKRIQNRLGKPIGCKATLTLLTQGKALISTETRESFSSFISTSNETSHKEATYYALSDLIFGNQKLCGVPELWLLVVYLITKDTEHLKEENFSGFINDFEKNVVSQLENNTTNLTLSGLTQHGPLVKGPVSLGIWYVVHSPKRFRAMAKEAYLDALEILKYPFDKKLKLHELAINEMFDWMYRLNKAENPVISLRDWVRSLYQNYLSLPDGSRCFLDGGPDKKFLENPRISLGEVEKIFTIKDLNDIEELFKDLDSEELKEAISKANNDYQKIKGNFLNTLESFPADLFNLKANLLSNDLKQFNIDSDRLNKICYIKDIKTLSNDIKKVDIAGYDKTKLNSLDKSIEKLVELHESNDFKELKNALSHLEGLLNGINKGKKLVLHGADGKVKKISNEKLKKSLNVLRRIKINYAPVLLVNQQLDSETEDFSRSLSIQEVIKLGKLITENKDSSVGNIEIPPNLEYSKIAIPDSASNYNDQENTTIHKTEICPLTLRPYSIDPSSKKKWLVAAEEKFGLLAGQISAYNYFIRYVSEENKFPSQEEFIRWLAEKQTQREVDPKDTLPKSILTIVHNLFNSFTTAVGKFFSDVYSEQAKVFFKNYEKAKEIYASKKNSFTLEDMPIELFIEITEKSRDKNRRIELESRCDTVDQKVINASGFFASGSSQPAESTLYSDISTPKLGSK